MLATIGRNSPSSRRRHDRLAVLVSEHRVELAPVVLGESVVEVGLSTEPAVARSVLCCKSQLLRSLLVNPLEDLVASSVAKSGEERQELLTSRSLGVFTEDDLGVGSLRDEDQLARPRSNAVQSTYAYSLVRHQPLRNCVYRVKLFRGTDGQIVLQRA